MKPAVLAASQNPHRNQILSQQRFLRSEKHFLLSRRRYWMMWVLHQIARSQRLIRCCFDSDLVGSTLIHCLPGQSQSPSRIRQQKTMIQSLMSRNQIRQQTTMVQSLMIQSQIARNQIDRSQLDRSQLVHRQNRMTHRCSRPK